MATKTFRIIGHIIDRETHQGVAGLHVEAWDKDLLIDDLIGSAVTDKEGRFEILFDEAYFKELFLDRRPDVFFKVFDRDALLLDTRDSVICNLKPGVSRVVLEVSVDEKTPIDDPDHTDISGPLVTPAILAKFDDLVARAVANAPELCYGHPVGKLRVLLANVPDLLDQATEVLLGNPIAARRFREMLGSFGGAIVPTTSALRIFETHQNNKCLCKQMEGTDVGPIKAVPFSRMSQQLIGMKRLEPVLAATVYASRDTDELATLVGGIELGLTGANELNTLFDLVLNGATAPAIASAFDTAVRVSSFANFPSLAGFTPGEDGLPVPGFGPGLGFGPRTGAPWFIWPPPVPGGGTPGQPEPEPIPEVPVLDPSLIEHFEQCMIFEIIPNLHRLGIGFRELVYGTSSNYVIEAVEPDNACPGDIITITGTNFDGVVAVRFVDGRGRTISVAPATATATLITVPLPAEAVSGPVWLYIPVITRLCLTEFVLARSGLRGSIRVGRPSIVAFGLEGHRGCVTRGTPIRLHWSVEPTDAEIRIIQVLDETETVLFEDVSAMGHIDVDTRTLGSYQFRIEVNNPYASCGTATAMTALEVREPTPIIEIVGVEVTQAIQIFNLADPRAASNNSVELIANMDTVLRVFVRSLTSDTVPVRISGTLEIDGIVYRPINRPSPFINTPREPLRAETNHSLNFLIPAADARGLEMPVTVRIFTAGYYCGDVEEGWTQTLSWADLPALPVTIRRIADSDGSVISARDALDLVRGAFRKMPSPMTAITLHPGVFQIHAGTTEDNYCNDGGYYQLALSVAYEHNDTEGYAPDPHESSWIGIYAQTGCSASGMMAWPWTSTCISQRNLTTAAHELMHTVGLGHTVTGIERCEDVAQPVACHRLPDRADGRLIQVPFNIENNVAVRVASDLMSYRGGNTRWLSPELWVEGRRLMNTRY